MDLRQRGGAGCENRENRGRMEVAAHPPKTRCPPPTPHNPKDVAKTPPLGNRPQTRDGGGTTRQVPTMVAKSIMRIGRQIFGSARTRLSRPIFIDIFGRVGSEVDIAYRPAPPNRFSKPWHSRRGSCIQRPDRDEFPSSRIRRPS